MLKNFQTYLKKHVYALIIMLLFGNGITAQTVVNVIADDGNDLVSKVNSATSGTIVNVPAGTYTVTSAMTLGSGVSLIGSNTGATVLNFNAGNRLFTIAGGDTVRIQNITVNADNSWRENGGAIHANGNTVKLVVENCRLSAFAGTSAGAMYVANGAYARVSNSEFLNSRTNNANGGAIAVMQATLDLINTSVHHCGTSNGCMNGGAIYAFNATLNVSGSKFYQNEAQIGGAFYISGGVTTISNSEIYENVLNGTGTGGAGYLIDNAEVTVSGTTITNNASTNGGAGFFLNGNNKLTLSGCTMVGNNNIGGNTNVSGGVHANDPCEIVIDNSIITGNAGGSLGDDLPAGVEVNVENSVVGNELIVDDTTSYTFTDPIVVTPGDSGQVSVTLPTEINDPETGEIVVIPVPVDDDGNPTIGSGEVIVSTPSIPPELTLQVSDSIVCVGDSVTFNLKIKNLQGTVDYRFYQINGTVEVQLETESNNTGKALFGITMSNAAAAKYVGKVYNGGNLQVVSNEVFVIVVPTTGSTSIDHSKNTEEN